MGNMGRLRRVLDGFHGIRSTSSRHLGENEQDASHFIPDYTQTAYQGLAYWRRTQETLYRFLLLAHLDGWGPISHINACRTRAILIIPDTKAPWFQLLKSPFPFPEIKADRCCSGQSRPQPFSLMYTTVTDTSPWFSKSGA